MPALNTGFAVLLRFYNTQKAYKHIKTLHAPSTGLLHISVC